MTLQGRLAESFEQFWAEYPKKRSKGQAKRAWAKIKPDEAYLFPKIMGALNMWKGSPEWQKDGGQFIPYPATWLNAEGWEDERPVTRETRTLAWQPPERRR